MKPLIGISSGKILLEKGYFYHLKELYCEKIRLSGGIPVILPYLPEDAKEVLSRLDGLMLSGGEDVDPASYGEKAIEACGSFHPEYDEAEVSFLKAAEELNMPVFCICRGMQMLNVYYGGTLYQDIEACLGISNKVHAPGNYDELHSAEAAEGTRLASVLNSGVIEVNSNHHQCIKDTALTVSAKDSEGIIEAVELPGERFVLGVQWHPEWMKDMRLFEAFVKACAEHI